MMEDRLDSKVSGIFSFKDIKNNSVMMRIICHPNYTCPMNSLSQMECKTCRISIRLIDDKEINEARKSGFIEVSDYAFACPLKIQGVVQLLEIKKGLDKAEIKPTTKTKRKQ